MKSRIMNTSVFQRKPSMDIQSFHTYGGSLDNSSKGSVAVSVRSSPPLDYQNLRRQPSLRDMNEDVIPYQIPQVFPTERHLEAVSSVASTPPKPMNSGRSRPLPVPNAPPATSLYTATRPPRNPSRERPEVVLQADSQLSMPSTGYTPSRRPLPQPRPSISNQPGSQPAHFSSSTYSSISSFPSLTHTHSRSISASTSSDATGVAFPHSSSSYQTTFSSTSTRPNNSLDFEKKPFPQTRPLALKNSHAPASAPPPRPLEVPSSIEYRKLGQTTVAKEVGFGRAIMRTEPSKPDIKSFESPRYLPPQASRPAQTLPTMSHRPPPLLLSKTPTVIPILPPLDFGKGISLFEDFQFSSPESIAPKSASYSVQVSALKENVAVEIPAEQCPVVPREADATMTPVPAPTRAPFHLPPAPVARPPLPPPPPFTALPPLPPFSIPPPLQSPSAAVLLKGSAPVSLTPVPPVSAGGNSGPSKKDKPVLALRTWDLEPPKRQKPKKMQVVQIQTIDVSEEGHDAQPAVTQEPPKPQPIVIHAPLPSRPETALTMELDADPAVYANRTVNYLQAQPRPSFLPQCDDEIWKVGEKNGPKSSAAPLSSTLSEKWGGRWSAVTATFKKVRLGRRRSKSVGGWEGGGVFAKADNTPAILTGQRPAFPHMHVATSSLSNLDSSLRPQPTPHSASFFSLRRDPPRSASAPRHMTPSLRNEPTFLDPHPGRFVPRPSTTTPIGRPIGALWTKLRLNTTRPLGRDERIDLL